MAAGVNVEQLADRDLGVDGRRFQLFVPEQLLDVADVGSAFQHVGGAGVPEQVAAALACEAGLLDPGGRPCGEARPG